MFSALALTLALSASPAVAGPCPNPLIHPLNDTSAPTPCDLSDELMLSLERATGASGKTEGWEVVVARADRVHANNLLYHSKGWHGPYPTQIMAWHEGKFLFPDERLLLARGHALELVVTVSPAKTEGEDTAQYFTDGNVTIMSRSIVPGGKGAASQRAAELRTLILDNLHFTAHLTFAVTGETIGDLRDAVSPEDIPALVALLGDEEAAVGVGAAGLLGVLGEAAEPALEEASLSHHFKVVTHATDALRQIEDCRTVDPSLLNPVLCPASDQD